MSDFDKNIDKIRKYINEHKAEQYPFENATLRDNDEYVKSLYFRMLCTLARYTGEASEMQVLYIQRLMAGANAEDEFQDYMKMALDLDSDDIDEFVSVFKDNDLKYYFCIDGSIVLAVGKPSDKNYELLAELVELLGITYNELKYLTSISKAIISQSVDEFNEAKENSTDTTKSLSLYQYVSGFYTGAIVDTHELRHIYSCNKAEINLSDYGEYKAEKIILENLTISLKENIVFDGCSEVIIRECTFKGNQNKLRFYRVGRVIIEKCEISDFSDRFAVFIDTNNINLNKNCFTNCGCISEKDINGGVFLCEGKSIHSINIENNKLLNCYVGRTEYRKNYWATGILLHFENLIEEIIVEENQFSGCECRNNGDYQGCYITGDAISYYEENNVCEGPVEDIFEGN